jgi:hypothetical protein
MTPSIRFKSDHVSVHRVKGSAHYPAQHLASEISTKYQAANMQSEALHATDIPRHAYVKRRTGGLNGDKSHGSEEVSSKISASGGPEETSSSSHHNLYWHKKSSTKYPAIREQRNTHFSSHDQHYTEKFQKLTHTANQPGALHGGTDRRTLKSIPLHADSLDVRKSPDKMKGNSLHSMKRIQHQSKRSFRSGDGVVGSNAMKLGEVAQGEVERNNRNEQYIHSRIEALKAAAKRENAMKEHERGNANRKSTKKARQLVSHSNDSDDNDHLMHSVAQTKGERLNIRKITRGKDASEVIRHQSLRDTVHSSADKKRSPPAKKKTFKKHGHSYSSSENEQPRTKDSIHSRIEALKAAAEREIKAQQVSINNQEEQNKVSVSINNSVASLINNTVLKNTNL